MTRRKLAVAVILAVTVVGAFAAYALRPTATSTNVVVNEPNTDTGNTGTGGGTTPSTPPTPPPARASEGPKHAMCVHMNDHIPEQARTHGANWYRFYDQAACTAANALASLISF